MSDRDWIDEHLDGGASDGKQAIPSVEIPSPPDGEPDQQIVTLFWRLVILFNISLLAIAVGVMFLIFESDLETGGLLVAIGGIAGLGGVVRYRRFKRSRIDQ